MSRMKSDGAAAVAGAFSVLELLICQRARYQMGGTLNSKLPRSAIAGRTWRFPAPTLPHHQFRQIYESLAGNADPQHTSREPLQSPMIPLFVQFRAHFAHGRAIGDVTNQFQV